MFATGPVGWAIGAGLLLVGLVLVLTGDNDFNKWARNCFWGNSNQYWGGDRPKPISVRINDAKALGRPNDPRFQEFKNYFDSEVRNFALITAE